VHGAAAGGPRERVVRLTEAVRLLPPTGARSRAPSGSRRNATTPGEAPRGWNEPAHVTDSCGRIGRAERRAARTRVARVPTEPVNAVAARGARGCATATGRIGAAAVATGTGSRTNAPHTNPVAAMNKVAREGLALGRRVAAKAGTGIAMIVRLPPTQSRRPFKRSCRLCAVETGKESAPSKPEVA
jgi:hypothetical protein